MFGSLGGGEILVLILVGLIVFGPERLPTVARDAAKVLRQLRQMAKAARDEINTELGPDVADLDLRSLHPRTFVQKHLFGEDDESRTLRSPSRLTRPRSPRCKHRVMGRASSKRASRSARPLATVPARPDPLPHRSTPTRPDAGCQTSKAG